MESEGIDKIADKNGKDCGIITRPNSSPGFWLCALLPVAYIIANWQYPYSSLTFEYKLTTIIAFGLFLQSANSLVSIILSPGKLVSAILVLLPGFFTSFLVWICLKQTETVSLLWGVGSTLFYRYAYYKVLRRLPRSFTLGEATIVVQGLVLFLLNGILQTPNAIMSPPTTDFLQMNAIMVSALFCLAIVAYLLYAVKFLRHVFVFYPLMVLLVIAVCIIPVTPDPPIVTLLTFLFNDMKRIFIIISYIGFLGLTVATVMWRLNQSEKATTAIRKIFHILIVCVYIPGFIYQCTLLYIASGICFALLVVLEIIRLAEIPPFSETLNKSVDSFVDEKDSGMIALTPFYLLVGCSLPMWISPCPCSLLVDTVESKDLLMMMSGVLTIGVGDTAASVIGSKYGKHKWPGSKKSFEGTTASVLCQLLIVYALYATQLNVLTHSKTIAIVTAILVTSIVEALTDQVDNIILPLIFYTISGSL